MPNVKSMCPLTKATTANHEVTEFTNQTLLSAISPTKYRNPPHILSDDILCPCGFIICTTILVDERPAL